MESEDEATLSGAHRSYRDHHESRLKDTDDDESEEELADERSEQEDKLYGVAIQFQKDADNVLRVFDIKKNGPAWNKGILKGDIIHDVDGITVYKLPFDQVSPLIKGPYDSLVTIGFLRPMVSEDCEKEIPFKVKMRRLEPVHGQAPASATHPAASALPHPRANDGASAEAATRDLSVEARFLSRTTQAAAVYAATGGLVGGPGNFAGEGPNISAAARAHLSLPLTSSAHKEGDGRRVHSADMAPGKIRRTWKSTAQVSAAERMELANDHQRALRQRRMRGRALQHPAPPHHPDAPSVSAGTHIQPAALPPAPPLPPTVPDHVVDHVLSSEELQRIDRNRNMNRLLQSRKPRPQSTIKGYGDHSDWLPEVEARRKARRSGLHSPLPPHLASSDSAPRRPPPGPSLYAGLYAECSDLAEGCRSCMLAMPLVG